LFDVRLLIWTRLLSGGKANGDIAEDITAYGKSLGQIGHRMLTDGKDLVVIDEWPDAAAFNKFFAGAARMGEFSAGQASSESQR
jgi:hypothetical protein